MIELRVITPCPAVRSDGKSCEHEAGHDSDHVTSVWALAEDGEMYPNHPEYWGDAT